MVMILRLAWKLARMGWMFFSIVGRINWKLQEKCWRLYDKSFEAYIEETRKPYLRFEKKYGSK